ncbi:MotA/TolQ/ExbB proton channel family protein [Sulfidibacter corallicola]|uniref:MotA/TolQ/ExbB proton channel family protein n=1 Tax=Sulfidibacter corallicola TaxID=2818388 RepID=A0A8A4TQ74_SULCO|nr:MotA/TolQ/ExbB proton channel family protein [Sulfidibacter corallicola]QTD51577.1 MotA/TolQ/ExbB proton channel family protein [Sulfidibacter corallicola]
MIHAREHRWERLLARAAKLELDRLAFCLTPLSVLTKVAPLWGCFGAALILLETMAGMHKLTPPEYLPVMLTRAITAFAIGVVVGGAAWLAHRWLRYKVGEMERQLTSTTRELGLLLPTLAGPEKKPAEAEPTTSTTGRGTFSHSFSKKALAPTKPGLLFTFQMFTICSLCLYLGTFAECTHTHGPNLWYQPLHSAVWLGSEPTAMRIFLTKDHAYKVGDPTSPPVYITEEDLFREIANWPHIGIDSCLIYADREAKYGKIQHLLAAMREAGLRRVQFMERIGIAP